ncbi:MAG: sigma-54-dependent Fis family transcriptional regulator [Zoogloeaceae bacterium]|uniref:sigma-54-dependent Fis family transcriptional regulator n=1 Tax=Denitromonas sp. TaxID=2734609 RepID=UPI001DF5FF94|nr:sigma-54-dependent Fis family transcriptional regulator [Rhodocyclaceae bacterium]MCP5220213.1 sigma-54-dependent Fis family transcriptional regulator [Zoogloeaceae bacterium]HQU87910.1 sigma-54-dependent Fis family transcriptional regulator [Denitromonas sp.]
MENPLLSVEQRDVRVRDARTAFFEQGAPADALVPMVGSVANSWSRCVQVGLAASAHVADVDPVSDSQLRETRDRNAFLLSHARGVLSHLYEQIRSTGSVVVLSDGNGLVLEGMGDADFVSRANQVALKAGAQWGEGLRGTNAIGTAIAEQRPVEVVGAEHFFDCNAFLTCSASPIFDAGGQLMGVLDISGDSRSHERHTLGLVRMSAQLLEKRLFEAEFGREILVFFHPRMEYVGSLQEGVLAFNQGGELLGANRCALELLKLTRNMLRQLDFSLLFDQNFGVFVDRSMRDPHALSSLPRRHGDRVYARMNMPAALMPSSRCAPAPAPTPAKVALAPARTRKAACGDGRVSFDCLDTGDARMGAAIQRATRMVGKDIPLLILGESGVGKEMFAKAFHDVGPRRTAPFVALNCAAIPENLIESELFGYLGGAFTGARKEGYTGKIQQACGGTLFLDEIGDMPLNLQARLLRVLQDRVVTPLGGAKPVPVDVSLVCATHRNLVDAVKTGAFRQDLYYRVNGLTVTLPSLRERSDIRAIVANIIAIETDGMREIAVSEEVLTFFERYRWPGNIRQMHNALRVAVALLDDDEDRIDSTHLPEELFAMESDSDEPVERAEPRPRRIDVAPLQGTESLETIEKRAIEQVLEEEGGNVSAAARRLGISRNTLYRKLGRM